MASTRYIIWAHRDAESLFGAATNPVIRNGALLFFDSEAHARVECDQLNAHSGNPHSSYSYRREKSTSHRLRQ
jgi:hypothetical protein